MACLKLGSKADAFKQEGQAWYCKYGLPSDITINVGDIAFHLHKFPLLSKSGLLEKLIEEKSSEDKECIIELHDIPGGPKSFELVAKFCYGIKFELTAANVVRLRCASELLEMTEEISENNLIFQTENFLNHVVLKSWKDTLTTLQSCEEELFPYAENLHVVKRCIESLAIKACTDPNLFGWPMMEHGPVQSPGGSVLWNGISTGAKPRNYSSNWWYEDVSYLSFPLYKKLISVMESRGISEEIIAGSITHYANKYLPGLNKRKSSGSVSLKHVHSEEEQRYILEGICNILPDKKGVVSTKFLFGLLRTAMIIKASESCILNLEKRAGMQLDEATLEDLLIPTYSNSMETLYNIDCVQRILEHFLEVDRVYNGVGSPCLVEDEDMMMDSSLLSSLTNVAKLIDGYLAEVASDANLKLPKFRALASAVPEYARVLDDGLYRAIDIYLKEHPWLQETDREQLCNLMDYQKLSLEACTHAAQNERLPLRALVQVLFFEQLQLRSSIAGCFQVSEPFDNSRPLRSGAFPGPTDNQVLKVGMDSMKQRVSELEKECSFMRKEIQKLAKEKSSGSSNGGWIRKLGLNGKNQMCSAKQDLVGEKGRSENAKAEKKLHAKLVKNLSIDELI